MEHKEWLKRGLCTLLMVGTLTPGFVYASQKDLNQAMQDKKAVEAKIIQKQESINSTKSQVAQVENEIAALDASITKASEDLSNVLARISSLEEEIQVAQKELEEAQAKLKASQDAFAQRIKVMYVNGDVGYLEVLLNSENMETFLSNVELVSAINKQDRKLVAHIKEQVDIIHEKKQSLENKQAELKKEQAQVESKKAALESANAAKHAYMTNLESNLSLYEEDYDAMQREEQELERRINQIRSDINEQKRLEDLRKQEAKRQAQRTAGSKTRSNRQQSSSGAVAQRPEIAPVQIPSGGGLMWPLSGYSRISSPFGYRVHPVLGTRKFHSGCDIPAPAGTPVHAAKAGVVITASYLGSYGNVVMIDHGDKVTVYAHNSSLKVRVGQQVSQGQVISLVGSTGRSTGPHCHFEVRVGGKAVNPLGYL